MGYAYGQLFATDLVKQFKNIEYMYPSVAQSMLAKFGVPESLISIMTNEILLEAANLMLDVNWQIALPFIPQRFIDEIKGISEGSGIPI